MKSNRQSNKIFVVCLDADRKPTLYIKQQRRANTWNIFPHESMGSLARAIKDLTGEGWREARFLFTIYGCQAFRRLNREWTACRPMGKIGLQRFASDMEKRGFLKIPWKLAKSFGCVLPDKPLAFVTHKGETKL